MEKSKPLPHVEWEKKAYTLTKEKGQVGAILFCEEMILEKQSQINDMEFYDSEQVSALQNSISEWGAIQSLIEKTNT